MDINNFNSVFDNAVEEEKAFDTIFGGEEDDELISVVLGEDAEDLDIDAMLAEEGDLPDMNNIDDGETVKQVEKDLEGKEIEAPKCEPSENVTVPEDIDSEKDKPGEQIACPQAGVADAVENREPDEEKLEDEIDKAENKIDLEEAFLAEILGEETIEETEKINYDTAAAPDTADKAEDTAPEDEKCSPKKEGEGCDDDECEDKSDSEIAPDDNAPVVYDGGEEENLDDVFSDEGEDEDDDDEESVDDSCTKKENVEEIEDNQTPEIEDNTEVNDDSQLDGEPGLPGEPGMDDEEVGLESTNLDDIFAETADETEEAEKIEDEIIDAAEDDAEMSDADVAALVGKDEEDDLLDAIIGE